MMYDVGDVVTLVTELRDADGTLTDSAVTLTVIDPDGVVSAPLVEANGGTGKYKASFTVDALGPWFYSWHASGMLTAADGGQVSVLEPGRLTAVAAYIGASPSDPLLAQLVLVANTMVDQYLGVDGILTCPAVVRSHAINQLASELFTRRNSPGGVVWAPGGDNVSRLARDAMVSVAPLLRAYAELGIA